MKENRPAMVPAQPGWRAVYFIHSNQAVIFTPVVAWTSQHRECEDEAEAFDGVVVDDECMGLADGFLGDDQTFMGFLPPGENEVDWKNRYKKRLNSLRESYSVEQEKSS